MEEINKKELSKLLVEIKKNNTQAFEELYKLYRELVHRIAFSIVKNKQDTEDIVQKVFTKIYTMDKNKLPSKNEASWLYTVTKNETINFLKKTKNYMNIEDIYEIEAPNNEIAEIIDKDSYYKIICGLNENEKEIISLKILADLSFDEIGQILNKPTGTVKWKYYQSIHTLKILLSNLGMLIISAIFSIVALKSSKKIAPTEPGINIIENETMREENINETFPKKENSIVEDNSIIGNNIIQIPENTIEIPNIGNKQNYTGIGFMGISILFFIITIFFSIIFTKHQLKRRKKLSK